MVNTSLAPFLLLLKCAWLLRPHGHVEKTSSERDQCELPTIWCWRAEGRGIDPWLGNAE